MWDWFRPSPAWHSGIKKEVDYHSITVPLRHLLKRHRERLPRIKPVSIFGCPLDWPVAKYRDTVIYGQ